MADIDKMQIKIEVDSSQVGKATDEIDKLKKGADNAVPTLKNFGNSIGDIAKFSVAAGAIYELTNATKTFVEEGVRFNAQLETMKIGIASLISASKDNMLVSGQAITAQEKFRLAQVQSVEVIQMLKKANLETSATLTELTQGFQAALGPATQAGLSIAQTVEYTKLMTQAAGAMGMSMHQLPQEMKSVVSGTIDLNSVVATNLGITNEQIKKHKEQGDLFDFLKSKLSDFAIAGNEVSNSLTGSVSNMSDAFSNLAGIVSKPLFDALKIEVQKTTVFLNDMADSVQKIFDRMKSVHELNTTEQLTTRAIEAYDKVIKKQKELDSASVFFGQQGKLSAELRAAKVELGAVNQQFELIVEMRKKAESVKNKPAEPTVDKKAIKEAEHYADFMRKLNDDTAKLGVDAATKEYLAIDLEEKNAIKKYGINYTRKADIYLAFAKKRQALDDKYALKTEEAMAEYDANETKKYFKLKDTIETSLNNINYKGLTKLYDDIFKEEEKALEDFAGTEEQKTAIMQLFIEKRKALIGDENNYKSAMALEVSKKEIGLIKDKFEKETALATMNYATNVTGYQKQAEEDPMLASYYNQLIEIENKLLEMSLDDISIKITLDGLDESMESIKVAGGEFSNFYNKSIDLQKEFAKEFLNANGDVEKEKIATAKFDKANTQLVKEQKAAEIDAYSSLAGAIGGALKEGSDAQKAFMLVSQSLSLYNAVGAVIQAWNSAPFPANLPAVATTSAAVVSLLSQIGTTLGGGGGASEVPAPATQEQMIEAQYNPMLDKLDMQIELLKAIEKNGSAQAVGVESAKLTYQRDMSLLVADLTSGGYYEKIQTYLDPRYSHDTTTTVAQRTAGLKDTVDAINKAFGDVVWSFNGSTASLNTDLIKTTDSFIEYFAALKQVGAEHLMVWGSTKDSWEYVISKANENIGKIQEVIGDYALSMTDIIGELSDAKNDFEQIFDDITGTTKYATIKLKEAFTNIEKLTTLENLPTYIEKQINAIKDVEDILNKDVVSLLLSKDTADFAEQIKTLSLLNEKLGTTYAMGTEDAINFIESLQLVSEAFTTSRENIKSFTDSLKTESQLAADMASSLGVYVVDSLPRLADMFKMLSNDFDGLTDSELQLINANMALIESTQRAALQSELDALNATLTSTTNSINTLNSALSTIDSIITTIRGSLNDSSYNLKDFYKSLDDLIALNGSKDYEAFVNALSDVSSKVSVLTQTSSFNSAYDMAFQQARVAAQMEDLNVVTLDEMDYLKQIEENTRAQVDLLSLTLQNLGLDIKSALLEMVKTKEYSDPVTKLVEETYNTILGRSAETSGLAYWTNEISSGTSPVNTSNIGIAVGTAAVAGGEISRADYVTALYTQGLNRTPTASEVDYWANQSITPTTELASLFKQLDPTFKSFAEGGIVTKPTFGLIGEAGYNEAVIPLKNSNDPLGTNDMQKELNQIKSLMIRLVADNSKMLTIDRAMYANAVA